MSLHPDQLALEQEAGRIECQRRQSDSLLDFFFFDSPLRFPWVSQAVEYVFKLEEVDPTTGRPSIILTPENRAFLETLMQKDNADDQICFWLQAVILFAEIKDYVQHDKNVKRVNAECLASYLEQVLPVLVDKFRRGDFFSVRSFVRAARHAYVLTVPCLVS